MPLEDWLRIAENGSDEDVREWILTGVKDGKPFTPYVPTIALRRVGTVLDFGCGLGRNFPFLQQLATHVVGFDLPPMIARCRDAPGVAGPELSDDWTEVSSRRFDLLFVSLVLQHIDTASIERYLADFARMAPVTYLLSRAGTDSGDNVFAILRRLGLFTAGECVEVQHDPGTHRLRAVGAADLDVASQPGNMAHYELLLRAV